MLNFIGGIFLLQDLQTIDNFKIEDLSVEVCQCVSVCLSFCLFRLELHLLLVFFLFSSVPFYFFFLFQAYWAITVPGGWSQVAGIGLEMVSMGVIVDAPSLQIS